MTEILFITCFFDAHGVVVSDVAAALAQGWSSHWAH